MCCIVGIWRPKELRQYVDVMHANRMAVPLRNLVTIARGLWTYSGAVVEFSLSLPIKAISKVTLIYLAILKVLTLFLPGAAIWIRTCSLLGLRIGDSSRRWAELPTSHLVHHIVQDGRGT